MTSTFRVVFSNEDSGERKTIYWLSQIKTSLARNLQQTTRPHRQRAITDDEASQTTSHHRQRAITSRKRSQSQMTARQQIFPFHNIPDHCVVCCKRMTRVVHEQKRQRPPLSVDAIVQRHNQFLEKRYSCSQLTVCIENFTNTQWRRH